MAHTKNDLVENSREHLQHEIGMFFGSAQLFPHLRPGAEPLGTLGNWTDVLRNAVVESFVVHLRNLIAFLYDKPKRKEGLTAEHYVRDVQAWRSARGPMGSLLRNARSRADREVAHLTTRRFFGTPPEKNWDALAMFKVVAPLLRTFRQHTPHDRLHREVRQLIDRVRIDGR